MGSGLDSQAFVSPEYFPLETVDGKVEMQQSSLFAHICCDGGMHRGSNRLDCTGLWMTIP